MIQQEIILKPNRRDFDRISINDDADVDEIIVINDDVSDDDTSDYELDDEWNDDDFPVHTIDEQARIRSIVQALYWKINLRVLLSQIYKPSLSFVCRKTDSYRKCKID